MKERRSRSRREGN